jgi:hypothetical protein
MTTHEPADRNASPIPSTVIHAGVDLPERQMAWRALVPGLALAGGAFGIGWAVGGWVSAVSALLGVLVVSVTFALYVLLLGWARNISPTAWQGATLGGWLFRVAVIIGCLFAVDGLGGDVKAFGIAAIVCALAVAIYEAWFVLTGRLQYESPPPATATPAATPASASASAPGDAIRSEA